MGYQELQRCSQARCQKEQYTRFGSAHQRSVLCELDPLLNTQSCKKAITRTISRGMKKRSWRKTCRSWTSICLRRPKFSVSDCTRDMSLLDVCLRAPKVKSPERPSPLLSPCRQKRGSSFILERKFGGKGMGWGT